MDSCRGIPEKRFYCNNIKESTERKMEIKESTECCVWIRGIGVGGRSVVE